MLALIIVAGTASVQANNNAATLAKDSYQIVVLSEVAKYANMQTACQHIPQISKINPREVLEKEVKPVLIYYSEKEGKSLKSVDAIIDQLLKASASKINNTPIAIHIYTELRNKISESNSEYCLALHQFIGYLIDSHMNSIKEIKRIVQK